MNPMREEDCWCELEDVRATAAKIEEENRYFEEAEKREKEDGARQMRIRHESRNVSLRATARNERTFLKFGRGRKGVR